MHLSVVISPSCILGNLMVILVSWVPSVHNVGPVLKPTQTGLILLPELLAWESVLILHLMQLGHWFAMLILLI